MSFIIFEKVSSLVLPTLYVFISGGNSSSRTNHMFSLCGWIFVNSVTLFIINWRSLVFGNAITSASCGDEERVERFGMITSKSTVSNEVFLWLGINATVSK